VHRGQAAGAAGEHEVADRGGDDGVGGHARRTGATPRA
jgi:hypothetical protein